MAGKNQGRLGATEPARLASLAFDGSLILMAGLTNQLLLLDRDAKVARAWQAKMLPATYVVGPDGVIRFQHRGELDWSKPEVRRQIAGLMK